MADCDGDGLTQARISGKAALSHSCGGWGFILSRCSLNGQDRDAEECAQTSLTGWPWPGLALLTKIWQDGLCLYLAVRNVIHSNARIGMKTLGLRRFRGSRYYSMPWVSPTKLACLFIRLTVWALPFSFLETLLTPTVHFKSSVTWMASFLI